MMWFWVALAIISLIFELSVGVFYFLILSIAFFITGFYTYLFDTNPALSIAIASFLSIIGIIVFSIINQKIKQKNRDNNALIDLDIGKIVLVEQKISNGQYLVSYRGALWEAVLEDITQIAVPGNQAIITNKNANTLIIRLLN